MSGTNVRTGLCLRIRADQFLSERWLLIGPKWSERGAGVGPKAYPEDRVLLTHAAGTVRLMAR